MKFMHVTIAGPFKGTRQQVLMIRQQQVLKTTTSPNDTLFYWKLAFTKRYLLIVHALCQAHAVMLFIFKVSVNDNWS